MSVLADHERFTWFSPTAWAARFAGTDGGVVSGDALGISISERFQRSVVGAVSLIVTDVPALVVAAVWRCTQKVSPTDARYSSTLVWPGPTVRAVARSQSLPTAQTSEPAFVVVRLPVGAPVAPFAVPTAPSLVTSAPMNDATVIDPT